MTLETSLIVIGFLIFLSIFANKLGDKFGIPALLIFLGIGMLAGSEGPGGIYFDDPVLAQSVGVVALALILFSGGMDTRVQNIRPVLWEGISLATIGVLIGALVVSAAANWLLDFPWQLSLLLGATISSTDAAAVFAVLRARGVNLKGRLGPLLEFESGSNDPMAVFLTVSMLSLIVNPTASPWSVVPVFILQMGLGALGGWFFGWMALLLLRRINLNVAGLYPALLLAIALTSYGVTAALGGSGFLAVYLTGIFLGSRDFLHRRSMVRFFDGVAWLMQICMFLVLGLLVFPSRLVQVAVPGLIITAALMFIARPLGVLVSLFWARFNLREMVFLSWTGLRGAVPIILATFPYLSGLPQADTIFNIVFFVVLVSVLIQGPSIPLVARWLGLEEQSPWRPRYPIEAADVAETGSQMQEFELVENSPFDGQPIVALDLPKNFLVVLVARGDDFIVPNGGTVLLAGDKLLVLADADCLEQVRQRAVPPSAGAPKLT
jgi:potassium/hydrogen antiporter